MIFSPAYVYTTGHDVNERISTWLCEGFRAERRRAAMPVDRGGKSMFEITSPKPASLSVFYGILRGTGDVMHLCEERGLDYVYVDHSYFDETRADRQHDKPHDKVKGYFRCVPNDRYFRHGGDMPSDRWERLGITINPWRTAGEHVVVVPVSRYVASLNGFDPTEWLEETIAEVRKHTDRPIITKPKDADHPLEDVLANAHALVTLDSNAGVQAALMGVPVFTGVSAAAAPFGCSDITKIETPVRPDREQHLWNLAYLQFTVPEIRNGVARGILQECFG